MNPRNTTTTRDGWALSYDASPSRSGVRLSVLKLRFLSERPKYQYGEGNGRVFASTEEARQWALERGYLQRAVTPYCRHCRLRHRAPRVLSNGRQCWRRSGFCPVLRKFVYDLPFRPRLTDAENLVDVINWEGRVERGWLHYEEALDYLRGHLPAVEEWEDGEPPLDIRDRTTGRLLSWVLS